MKTWVVVTVLALTIVVQGCAMTAKERESRKKAAQYNAQLGLNYMNR